MSDSTTPTPQKGRSKLLTIGVPAIVLLLGGAGAGFWYVQNVRAAASNEKGKEAEDPEEEATGLVTFDPFTLNLADPGGRRYLRVVIGLVLPDPEAAKKVEEEDLIKSKVRSKLIDELSGRTAADVSTPEGRASLKKAIKEGAESAGHLEVRDVLFTDFIVQ